MTAKQCLIFLAILFFLYFIKVSVNNRLEMLKKQNKVTTNKNNQIGSLPQRVWDALFSSSCIKQEIKMEIKKHLETK